VARHVNPYKSMKPTFPWLILAGFAGAAGADPSHAVDSQSAALDIQCPTSLFGVDLSLEPAPGGIVLEFTRPSTDYVREFRKIVRDAAQVVEQHTKMKVLNTNTDELHLPDVKVTVTDTKSGARVFVKAKNAKDVKQLRRQALAFEQFWDDFECVTGPQSSNAGIY
jgi:hypothetical protein